MVALFAAAPGVWAIDLCPTHTALQSGGGMGAVSFGPGWKYGKRASWETDLFIGLVPKHSSSSAKVSIALKENYVPWHIRFNNDFSVEPLTASLYFTTLISSKVWFHLPERYSGGYYYLPTKIRANISLGQRIKWNLPRNSGIFESISAYYEIGTCDIYVMSVVGNSDIKFHELLQLCIGIRMNFSK